MRTRNEHKMKHASCFLKKELKNLSEKAHIPHTPTYWNTQLYYDITRASQSGCIPSAFNHYIEFSCDTGTAIMSLTFFPRDQI